MNNQENPPDATTRRVIALVCSHRNKCRLKYNTRTGRALAEKYPEIIKKGRS